VSDELAELLQRPQWHKDAACIEHPEIGWFPALGESANSAKKICRSRLVRAPLRWL
jgi:hypothetical protein